jgi:hypothetical protein
VQSHAATITRRPDMLQAAQPLDRCRDTLGTCAAALMTYSIT